MDILHLRWQYARYHYFRCVALYGAEGAMTARYRQYLARCKRLFFYPSL